MAIEVIMPSLGFDMVEGVVSRWLKEEGDPVKKGEVIVEIETEKANVEVEAAASGVLEKIVVPAGETVPVGTVIGVIAAAGEKPAGKPEEEPKERPKKEPKKMPKEEPGQKPKEKPPEKPLEKPKEEQEKPAEERKKEPETEERPERRVKASPVARKMAEEAGIDLEQVRGSGPDGRIMERDVQEAMGEKPPRPKPEAPAGEPAPMSRMRKAIARRMAESKAKAPHFYVTVDINMDEAMKLREQLNRLASESEKITVNDLIVAAAARTLSRFPEMNATYREESIEKHSRIDIGIAVALPDGLIPPVLRGADRKSLREIAAGARELGERARAGKLRSEDLGPGTFTISNLGMFDVEEFIAIINPPEAAILAVGAVTPRPVASEGQVRIARMMKATLSVDHRAADGAQAGRFMQELKKLLENPVLLVVE